MRGFALLLLLLVTTAAPVAAQWDASRPDSYAPIGVMGDHRHEQGELMLSYRYGLMFMDGSRAGTDQLSNATIISPSGNGFLVTPTEMPMHMHMLGVMYGLNDRITLMGMGSWNYNRMDHITRGGGTFSTESSGIGDLRAGAMIGLGEWGDQTVHLNAMVSFPTGSIGQEDVLPTSNGNEVQLPYPMQIGSGTFDLMPGITWLGQSGDWSWGAQGSAVFRLDENDRGWALGDQYVGTAWWGRSFSDNFSGSLRIKGTRVEEIEGADSAPSVNPGVVPTARVDTKAGSTVEGGIGFNVYVPQTDALRLSVEGLFPLYRELDGPQLETDWTIVVGFQLVPIG